jgi:ubiquinone/menaquinone biosynthesis C-methylase UbiE
MGISLTSAAVQNCAYIQMANRAVSKWVNDTGLKFLASIGVESGNVVLDFGCGDGHYALPAAKLVGDDGIVYAIDKNTERLSQLKGNIEQVGAKNIALINGQSQIPLQDNSIDLALCYDVIHFMNIDERNLTYKEINRILKNNGIFSVYPKHHKNNYPLMKLANMELNDVIREINESGLLLHQKFTGELLHDDYIERGYVLNFRKGEDRAVDRY